MKTMAGTPSTKLVVSTELDHLQAKGIIDYWQLQSGMPGLRWSICINGAATIAYSTAEIQAFIRGALAAS